MGIKNCVLRRICGSEREKITGLRKLPNSLLDIELDRACIRHGKMRNAYKMLVRKPRHRWEDNIKRILRE
jgi:hypothetical protein